MTELITEDWLRRAGFRWEQLERQPSKHWILWIAPACIDPGPDKRMFASTEDLGIEIASGDQYETWWHCWLRADYSGRYSRFLHVRHLAKVAEIVQLIEALTGRKWDDRDVLYGAFRDPETAARMRAESERLDRRIAADWGERVDTDASQRGLCKV